MKPFLLLLLIALASCATMPTFEQFQADVEQSALWSGGPDERFETVGRNTLAAAIRYGLMPDHKVLDIGAGSLRVGWWLLQYIKPANYYVIEPDRGMIDPAARIVGVDFNIYYNSDFEYPEVDFDFVLARSIWTHASKPMITKMLAEFSEHAAPDARFLASVIFAQSRDEEYMGEEWVGRGPDNDKLGLVKHSLDWITRTCIRHGLWVEVKETLHKQTWVLIGKVGDTQS
jgi:hypothetical protein